MGYYVRRVNWKTKKPDWKVQYVSYKKSDASREDLKKPKKEWDIPRLRWKTLGFYYSMTIEEAKARAKQLNSQNKLKKEEEKLRQLQLGQMKQQDKMDAYIPTVFVAEFERRFIRNRDSETELGVRRKSRAFVIWRAAQKMMIDLQIEPSEWFEHSFEVYDYFYHKKYSLSYLTKIMRMANLWGFFICKKMARPFLPVPYPRGYERQRLAEAYYTKQKACKKPSLLLLPEKLQAKKEVINIQNYNWLYLSVWFGLRPQEIDQLKDQRLWRIETTLTERKILWVYQTKIIALPTEERWKPIPILYPEQEEALKIIESQYYKRPLVQTMRRHFGMNVHLYAGRKGFTDLMLKNGHSLESISQWMGHTTIGRTWRNYKCRTYVQF